MTDTTLSETQMPETRGDTMASMVLVEPGRIVSETRPVPQPEPDEVLVRVSAVGVCGSDVHYFQDGRIGDFVVRDPLVLGHEVSGRIVAVGAGVAPDRIGTRVAIEPQRPCGRCTQCRSGAYNLCPQMEFYATPPIDGAFCEYVTIQDAFAHQLPAEVSDEQGALIEPLSVGIAACRKAGTGPASSLLITGAGPVGMLVAQVAHAFGASTIAMVDPVERRRRFAEGFCHARTYAPGALPEEQTFDAFVDCSGSPAAVADGIRRVRPAGSVVLVGIGPGEVSLPTDVLMNRELRVTGVFRYVDTWPVGIDLVARGVVDLDPLITARFPLSRAADALRASTEPRAIKVIVRP